MPVIYVRVSSEDLARMLERKGSQTWKAILKRGLELKSDPPGRREVQSMIDESIERARRGY